MKIYMDACCLSRLTDDHSQARIREEAEAVEHVLAAVRRGAVDLVTSEALEEEVRRNSSIQRRAEAQTMLSLAATRIEIDGPVVLRAQDLVGLGYSPFDALHIAAAEFIGADVLLTTDDRLLRRTARKVGSPRIPVRNPLSWIKERGL
ncbi:MAG: PIN domain-containing protein [Candidatus Solibacter usitatus]|nr:PIN domain-containing protein [Candidatus Solibacter usitatus]